MRVCWWAIQVCDSFQGQRSKSGLYPIIPWGYQHCWYKPDLLADNFWRYNINHHPRLSSYVSQAVSLRFKESCGRPRCCCDVTLCSTAAPCSLTRVRLLVSIAHNLREMEKKRLSSTCLNQLSAIQARWGWRPRLIAPACLKVWMK